MSEQSEEEVKVLISPQVSRDEEKDEEYANEKNRKRSHYAGSMTRYMIIATTCLVIGSIAITYILPSDISRSVEKSSLRPAIEPTSTDLLEPADNQTSNNAPEDESKLYSQGTKHLNNAKGIVENAEEDAYSRSNDYLNDVIKEVELTMKKAIEQLLEKKLGYSTDQVEEVESEIFNKLEEKVHERLKSESSIITQDAEHDMDAVFENDVLGKVDLDGIEKDVDAMREYFVDEAQREVDSVALNIKKNIRDIAEEVETEVISEKLGTDTAALDLENAELEVQVSDAMSDIGDIEKKDFSGIESSMSHTIKETNENMQVVLREFLLNEKGLNASDVDAIEEEITKRIEEHMNKEVEEITESMEDQVDQAMHIELDGLVEEDKYILDRAKKLGLVSGSQSDGNNNKDVDLIEKDISSVKENFDEYLEEVSQQITAELKDSLQGLLEDIEKKVLSEKGVEMSQNEMEILMEKENKN